jgi:hypothetical protein
VDEIEQRAAWFALRRQTDVLERFPGLASMSSRLRDIGNEIGTNLSGILDSASMTMTTPGFRLRGYPFSDSSPGLSAPTGTLQVIFTDGSSVLTSEGARFDVYGRRGTAINAKSARELEPGDEVIVTNSATQARFSDMILERLDAGILKTDVGRRAEWLHLVQSFAAASGLTPTVIVQRLAALGHEVDRASARSWTSKADDVEPAVPSRYSTFAALAQALNMPHSDTQLRELYLSVRRVRTVHRLAGRALARAIRLAHLGVLDAPSQHRLQRQWGIQAHELQDAARIATVDQVLG